MLARKTEPVHGKPHDYAAMSHALPAKAEIAQGDGRSRKTPCAHPLGEEALVARARVGDTVAFAELVLRYDGRIKARLFHITRNRQDADDVFQEAVWRAFVHLKTFQSRSSFSTWLTRIAINCALMRLRSRRAIEVSLDNGYEGLANPTSRELVDEAGTPEEKLLRAETAVIVREAIMRLPERLRTVVQMRHACEYSCRDIADALGVTLATVKSRLFRARVLLRASLKESLLISVPPAKRIASGVQTGIGSREC